MRPALCLCAAVMLGACYQTFHEFDTGKASKVADLPPPPLNSPGRSHEPYTGKPKYLASSRPLQATTSKTAEEPCAKRSQTCEDRLRAVLASLDGQILALSSPPTELQLSALRLQIAQLGPLLAPYPDIQAEGEELIGVVDKLPSLSSIQFGPARRRLTELTDLIRVQLAAGE
ncbi:MAG: hypothetical protein ACXVDD_29075 [Polyangia bacterium]